MLQYTDYNISTLRPYINWLYFYFAWGLSGKPQEAKDRMRAEAEHSSTAWRRATRHTLP